MSISDLSKPQEEFRAIRNPEERHINRQIGKALLALLESADELPEANRQKAYLDFINQNYGEVVGALDSFSKSLNNTQISERLWNLGTTIGIAYLDRPAYFSRQPLNKK